MDLDKLSEGFSLQIPEKIRLKPSDFVGHKLHEKVERIKKTKVIPPKLGAENDFGSIDVWFYEW